MASPSHKVIASTLAIAAVGGAYILFKQREDISRRSRARSLSKHFKKYRKEAEEAIYLALQCGSAMRKCVAERSQDTNWKDDNGIDPVTNTDIENEKLVIKGLMEKFPGYKVIGEEAASLAGYIPATDRESPTWIIDPIDGTQNFVHGTPLSVVSIGLFVPSTETTLQTGTTSSGTSPGEPVLGIVYDPYKDEVFTGVKGEGAYLNGTRIYCDDNVKKIHQALVICDFGYDRSKQGVKSMVRACGRLLNSNTQSIRIVGSSVLSLVWVACGRANAFVVGFHQEGGKPWDYCAGHVICVEAGAVFKQLDARTWANADTDTSKLEPPEKFDIYSQSCICAGSKALADEIFDIVDDAPGSKSSLIF